MGGCSITVLGMTPVTSGRLLHSHEVDSAPAPLRPLGLRMSTGSGGRLCTVGLDRGDGVSEMTTTSDFGTFVTLASFPLSMLSGGGALF